MRLLCFIINTFHKRYTQNTHRIHSHERRIVENYINLGDGAEEPNTHGWDEKNSKFNDKRFQGGGVFGSGEDEVEEDGGWPAGVGGRC